jgi:hypothetical protein
MLRTVIFGALGGSFVIAAAFGVFGLAAAQSRGVSPRESTETIEKLLRYYLLDVFFVTSSRGWTVGGDGPSGDFLSRHTKAMNSGVRLRRQVELIEEPRNVAFGCRPCFPPRRLNVTGQR